MTHRLLLAAILVTAACGGEATRQYGLRGQVVAIDPGRQELTIKHEAIAGYMVAMTMPFRVKDERLLEGRTLGELVDGTLEVSDIDAHLVRVTHVGHVPLDRAALHEPARSGFELLKPGESLPDVSFIDHLDRRVELSSLRGQAVALTFIYTRCPVPTFCPAMDRQFAAVQRVVKGDASLQGRVQLLSVSFDPAFDTPAVLREHASRLDTDPEVWRFVTGDRDEIDRFAARFGVMIVRGEQDLSDIAHNLRTAVIDADGTLVSVYTGYAWKPSDIVKDLIATLGSV